MKARQIPVKTALISLFQPYSGIDRGRLRN